MASYNEKICCCWKGPPPSPVTPVKPSVFFDFMIEGIPAGRVVINLFWDHAPKTINKFVQLCSHELGVGYRGSKVRHIDGNYCSMGDEKDLTYPDNNNTFPSELKTSMENLFLKRKKKHDREGLVTMQPMYQGSDKKTWSYFHILFTPWPAFDSLRVIIGEVAKETWPVVEKIKKSQTNHISIPSQQITITKCGVVS